MTRLDAVPVLIIGISTILPVLSALGFTPSWLAPWLVFLTSWIGWCLGLSLMWMSSRLDQS